MIKRRAKKLTEAEKQNIIEAYDNGISPSVTSGIIGKSTSAIKSFFSRFKLNRSLPPKDNLPKGIIQGRMALQLKKIVKEHPKLGIRKLTQKLREYMPNEQCYPSKSTIGVFLKRSNFKKIKPSLKPPLSRANKLKRLAFAKKWLSNGVCTLQNVIWTDVTRLASHPNNRKVLMWSNTGEVPPQVKMHSGGNSVMFWGSFSKHGAGKLVSIKGTVDADEYIRILEENLIPEINKAKEWYPGVWRLMQDNAPRHTAKAVKVFLRRERVQFIDWPPYSSDLNPIENIWHWMKHVLETEFPVCQSAEEIESRFFEIWERITPEMCGNYCANYEKRLLAVIAARGGYTKY
jgi:transposase